MKYINELGKEEFEALLSLLSDEREEAGERYESIRRGLIRFFEFKGCADPMSLADETINRVAAKLEGFDRSRQTKPESYFYGFAANILREYKRSAVRETVLEDTNYTDAGHPGANSDRESGLTCLDKCLERLRDDDKKLIAEYYAYERQEKLAHRQELAERMGCGPGALYTRVFRIKKTLRKCVEKCVAAKL